MFLISEILSSPTGGQLTSLIIGRISIICFLTRDITIAIEFTGKALKYIGVGGSRWWGMHTIHTPCLFHEHQMPWDLLTGEQQQRLYLQCFNPSTNTHQCIHTFSVFSTFLAPSLGRVGLRYLELLLSRSSRLVSLAPLLARALLSCALVKPLVWLMT